MTTRRAKREILPIVAAFTISLGALGPFLAKPVKAQSARDTPAVTGAAEVLRESRVENWLIYYNYIDGSQQAAGGRSLSN
jgi:hypothetical protein